MHVDACKEGNAQDVLISNSILYLSLFNKVSSPKVRWGLEAVKCWMSSSVTILWHKACCRVSLSFKIELENSFTWALNKKLVMLMSNSDKLALLYVLTLYSFKKENKKKTTNKKKPKTQTTPPSQQNRQSEVERNSRLKCLHNNVRNS